MRKLFCLVLALLLFLLSACAPAAPTPDPIPDPPVQSDPIPDPPAEDETLTEEPVEETPEDAPDLSALQAEVEAFLSIPGANGFLCGAGRWPEGQVRLREVIYQLSDESCSYDAVAAAYEAALGEVHTDLSYITAAKLDELLTRLTGHGLYENGEISPRWDLSGADYLEALDVYCIQHGDTNYQPLRAEVTDPDPERICVRLTCRLEDMDLFCFIDGEFVTCTAFELVLCRGEDGALRFAEIHAVEK